MMIKRVRISSEEYEGFRSLQLITYKRTDWCAIFSVNPKEEVWPFACYGRTPEDKRDYVTLIEQPRLSEIARYFISNIDEGGGRLFFSQRGVFFIHGEKESAGNAPKQFIEWAADDSLALRWREANEKVAAIQASITRFLNLDRMPDTQGGKSN